MKYINLLAIVIFISASTNAQNVGIGTNTPTEKLHVNGNIRTTGIKVATGGAPHDLLRIVDSAGTVGYKKGHGAVAINYIIALHGLYPSQSGNNHDNTLVGEIKMFAGNFAPNGWAFCNGQLLPINQNQALFSLLGTMYGGNGQTNFALPDLRGAAPLHFGTSPAGYQWTQGQKTF
jgi:microcystin-dependent protein